MFNTFEGEDKFNTFEGEDKGMDQGKQTIDFIFPLGYGKTNLNNLFLN